MFRGLGITKKGVRVEPYYLTDEPLFSWGAIPSVCGSRYDVRPQAMDHALFLGMICIAITVFFGIPLKNLSTFNFNKNVLQKMNSFVIFEYPDYSNSVIGSIAKYLQMVLTYVLLHDSLDILRQYHKLCDGIK